MSVTLQPPNPNLLHLANEGGSVSVAEVGAYGVVSVQSDDTDSAASLVVSVQDALRIADALHRLVERLRAKEAPGR